MIDDADVGTIRVGGPADLSLVTELFDEAIDWLIERGQTGQWGTEHGQDRPDTVQRFATFAAKGWLRIAEDDGRTEGVLVLGDAPTYVPAPMQRELYVLLLITSRRRAGRGIGARLIRRAAQEASSAGCRQLRVDCWSGAPSLVAWYETNGFERDGKFVLNGWAGQILRMPLP